MKDLRAIANTVYADSVSETPIRWNTPKLQETFKLDDQQVQRVKRYTKEIARDNGLMWGYDPEVKFFRIAPANAQPVANRMKTYVIQHWMDAGNAAVVSFEGAERQGYADGHEVQQVKDIRGEFAKRLAGLGV